MDRLFGARKGGTRERSDLLSRDVSAGRRTYRFDVRTTAHGAKYLVILESRPGPGGRGRKDQVMVFEDHLDAFAEGLAEAVQFIRAETRGKAYSVTAIRRTSPRAYMTCTEQEEVRLAQMRSRGVPINDIAVALQRQPSAIRSRLRKLALR